VDLDKKRRAAVRALEALGYTYRVRPSAFALLRLARA
jgi:hypothetical protein